MTDLTNATVEEGALLEAPKRLTREEMLLDKVRKLIPAALNHLAGSDIFQTSSEIDELTEVLPLLSDSERADFELGFITGYVEGAADK